MDVSNLLNVAIPSGLTGFATALVTIRVHRNRVDSRLTWLEDATQASLQMLVALGTTSGAAREVVDLCRVLGKSPRIRP